jgi:hypothetical protein
MPHPSQDLLVAYVTGEADPASAATIREHLTGCDACARVAHEIGEVDDLLRRLPAVPASPDFAARARARVQLTPARPSLWGQAVAAIVLAAAGLAAGWGLAQYASSSADLPIVRNSDGPKFAMIFAEDPATLVDLSDEERRRRYDEFMAWMRSIDDDIVHLGGSELDTASGGVVSAADRAPGQPLVLSGFIVVRSTRYEDVARHAERCPIVGRGGQVIVRPLR